MFEVTTESINRYYVLREPLDKHQEDLQVIESDEQDTEKEEAILCAQCRHSITSPSQRIEINGMHQHTFFNPYGVIYQIGCFRSANGCRYSGPATEEFSWFPGYRWRIAVCSACLTHLGWLYTSPDKESFHGLILDHLIQPE